MTWWDWFIPEAQRPDPEPDKLFEAHVDEIKRTREAAEDRVRKLEGLLREVAAVRPWPAHARGLRARIGEALEPGQCLGASAQIEKDRQVIRMILRLQQEASRERDAVTLQVCQEALDGDTEARLEVGTLYAEKFRNG